MTVFESSQTKTIDELAEWLDKHVMSDDSPWIKWFDENYCRKCEPEFAYIELFDNECECAWCEIHKKCKHFQDMDNAPDNKQIIKMWLESEVE
jgi:hypothetical protein